MISFAKIRPIRLVIDRCYLPKLVFSVVLLHCSTAACAEGISITPFVGYQFGGSAPAEEGELLFEEAANKGFTIEIRQTSITMIQLLYITQESAIQFKDNVDGKTEKLFDLRTEYFHIGGIREILDGNDKSFVSGSFGATLFKPSDSRYTDETLFSMSFGYGVDLEIFKKLSIILQGRILLPFQTSSSSLFCSGGCIIHVQGSTSIIQYDVTAGVQFSFV